jgi:hypothetical protein
MWSGNIFLEVSIDLNFGTQKNTSLQYLPPNTTYLKASIASWPRFFSEIPFQRYKEKNHKVSTMKIYYHSTKPQIPNCIKGLKSGVASSRRQSTIF